MLFNDKERAQFEKLKNEMLDATSPEEVTYYTEQIEQLLNKVGRKDKLDHIELTARDKEEFNSLKNNLLLATHPHEVEYYENKIHALLDRIGNKS